MTRRYRAAAVLLVAALLGGAHEPGTATPAPVVATPAPSAVVAELRAAIEVARQRFEARDRAGVLASVSERYRSAGLTKAAVGEQLSAMFALYQELRARVTVDRVEMVGGGAHVYTTGEVTGRLPFVGWVIVLAWQGEPEVARREAAGWRLFGFQD
jgi:hypothetical protein